MSHAKDPYDAFFSYSATWDRLGVHRTDWRRADHFSTAFRRLIPPEKNLPVSTHRYKGDFSTGCPLPSLEG